MGRNSLTKSSRAPRHQRVLQDMDSRPLELAFAWQATHLLDLGSNPLGRLRICSVSAHLGTAMGANLRGRLRICSVLGSRGPNFARQATHLLAVGSNLLGRLRMCSVSSPSGINFAWQATYLLDLDPNLLGRLRNYSPCAEVCTAGYAFARLRPHPSPTRHGRRMPEKRLSRLWGRA